jgi:hypothetical protein
MYYLVGGHRGFESDFQKNGKVRKAAQPSQGILNMKKHHENLSKFCVTRCAGFNKTIFDICIYVDCRHLYLPLIIPYYVDE